MVRQVQATLEVATIKHGLFLKQLNDQLVKGTEQLTEFVAKHPGNARGAKVKITAEITMACDGGETHQELYSIKASSKMSVPAKPALVSSLNLEESQTDGLEFRVGFTEGYTEEEQTFLPLKRDPADETQAT